MHETEAGPKNNPADVVLILAGVLMLVGAIGIGFGYLYRGLTDQLAVIESNQAIAVELPTDRPLILTRRADLAPGAGDDPDRQTQDLTVQITGPAAFTADTRTGWLEIQSVKQDLLGTITVSAAEPVTLTIAAEAYPIVIRHDPLSHAVRSLIITALAGSFALALAATGVFIAIKNHNARQRHRQALIDRLC